MKNERRLHWLRQSCLNPIAHRCNDQNPAGLKNADDFASQDAKVIRIFDEQAAAAGLYPAKLKGLISVAVALTTQCPHCIDIHSNDARNAGVTDAEMFEVTMVVAALQAGAAIPQAVRAGAN